MGFIEAGDGYHHLFTGWIEPMGEGYCFTCAATGGRIDLEDFEPDTAQLDDWVVLDRLENRGWSVIAGLWPASPEMIVRAKALMNARRVNLKRVV